jgi:hypothetical protein
VIYEDVSNVDHASRRNLLFSAFTGRHEVETSGKSTDIHAMLATTYGIERRGKTSIDTRKASKDLGVSQRTIQRWLKEENKPKLDNLKKIQTKSRQAASTKRGRQTALKASPKNVHFKKYGAHLTVKGVQGPPPGSGGKAYTRDRLSQLELDPDTFSALMDAFEQGGEKSAVAYLEGIYNDKYVADWSFGTIRELTFNDLSTRGSRDPRSL